MTRRRRRRRDYNSAVVCLCLASTGSMSLFLEAPTIKHVRCPRFDQ